MKKILAVGKVEHGRMTTISPTHGGQSRPIVKREFPITEDTSLYPEYIRIIPSFSDSSLYPYDDVPLINVKKRQRVMARFNEYIKEEFA